MERLIEKPEKITALLRENAQLRNIIILAIDLYRKADFAMYHAKSSGRNCISFNGNIVKSREKIVAQEPVKEVIL